VFETFSQDLRRWVVPGQVMEDAPLPPGLVLRLAWRHLPVRATALFRLASWFKRRGIPFFPGFLQRFNTIVHGIEIASGADIGGGLYVAHPVGMVVNARRIGRNCSLIAAITIGMRNEWAFPDIGDDVFIGAGARILGGIRIGDGAIIGANAVVIQDIPDGATAVGIPARVIRIKGQPPAGELAAEELT
jgi:serine O-acetyltransferase